MRPAIAGAGRLAKAVLAVAAWPHRTRRHVSGHVPSDVRCVVVEVSGVRQVRRPFDGVPGQLAALTVQGLGDDADCTTLTPRVGREIVKRTQGPPFSRMQLHGRRSRSAARGRFWSGANSSRMMAASAAAPLPLPCPAQRLAHLAAGDGGRSPSCSPGRGSSTRSSRAADHRPRSPHRG
jgi:hypothetical protein